MNQGERETEFRDATPPFDDGDFGSNNSTLKTGRNLVKKFGSSDTVNSVIKDFADKSQNPISSKVRFEGDQNSKARKSHNSLEYDSRKQARESIKSSNAE